MLGISVDSKFCHKAWSNGFGGITFPLLADFHPKGGVAESYGLWLAEAGITDRATVLIGKDGKVSLDYRPVHTETLTTEEEGGIELAKIAPKKRVY